MLFAAKIPNDEKLFFSEGVVFEMLLEHQYLYRQHWLNEVAGVR